MATATCSLTKKSSCTILSFFLVFLITFSSPSLSAPAKMSYADHCSSFVPESTPVASASNINLKIHNSYFSGGNKILGLDPDASSSSNIPPSPNFFSFYCKGAYRTKTDGLFHVTCSIYIVSGHRKQVNFENLFGFWSKTTGKICMVGSSYSYDTSPKLSAVFKLHYPANTNISSSVVSGIIESLDSPENPNHFDSISTLGYVPMNYSYTQMPRVRGSCSKMKVPIGLLGFEPSDACNYLPSLIRGQYQLKYESDCTSGNCGTPFSNKNGLGVLPTFMILHQIFCFENGTVHTLIRLSDTAFPDYLNLIPGNSLVAEGYWDWEKKLLCLVACPVLEPKDYLKDSSVGECTIGLTFWFHSVVTIENPSNILGQIWSIKDQKAPGYFKSVSFQSMGTNLDGFLPGLKYAYTKLDSLKSSCKHNRVNSLGDETYPDGSSIIDLTFELSLRNVEGNVMLGNAVPLSFGDKFFGRSHSTMAFENSLVEKSINVSQNLWNVSYSISYTSFNSAIGLSEPKHFSAEGTYNSAMGTFCMVGCRLQDNSPKTSMDCEIVISIQLSPLNLYNGENIENFSQNRRHVNGTIRSTREKADPLFFEPLEVSSNNVYQSEAIKSMRRMDMEVIMVMVSCTLVCVFIVFQLFYVKKHRDVIPSISITMLVIMMLGYMIPLVLNFEAVFVRHQHKTNVLLWSGGWLEVTEVIVRVMTMVAFLLHFRLLQLAWTAKSSEDGRKGLLIAEIKTLLFCLLVYFSGAIVSWSIRKRANYPRVKRFGYNPNQNCLLMDYLRSYAGSIIDGYLLPQIILNIISGSKDKALSPLFYMGITLIRVIPHLYVPYRARNFAQHLKSSYIYANPDEGFYSPAGNKVIPVISILFTVLIFLQQRFGGKFIVPQRFRRRCGYETVPVISLESYGDYGQLR